MQYLKFTRNGNLDLYYTPTILKYTGNENLKKGFETPPNETKRKALKRKRKK